MSTMEVIVLGAGALGSLIGGLLAQKYPVTLIGRKEHISAIRERGLRIAGKSDITVYPEAVEGVAELNRSTCTGGASSELIILTVKSYDTENAVREALPIIHERTVILSLQNGLDNELRIVNCLRNSGISTGNEGVLGGVTCHGATYLEPGIIYHAGTGETIIGTLDGAITPEAEQICRMFNAVGIETSLTRDIEQELWVKAVINASINPLTALAGIPNGQLLEIPELTGLMEDICREACAVASAAGVPLSAEELIERTKNVARSTAANKSSMLQDIEHGRRTEIDAINYAIVRAGKDHGIATPINATIVKLMKALEASTSKCKV